MVNMVEEGPTNPLKELVYTRLREKRISESDLPELTGLPEYTITNILRRTRQGYTVGTLRQLGDPLQLDLVDLVRAHERDLGTDPHVHREYR